MASIDTLAEPATAAGAPLLEAVPAVPDATSAIPDATSATPGLEWAFRLHSDGSAEPLPINAPIEFSHDGRLWLHFNLTDVRARSWFSTADIPPLARDLLLSHDNYQQLHTSDQCV